MSVISVQDQHFPELPCFGCGPANADGLRLKSFVEGDLVVASFTGWPQHNNGLGFLNGGIIATVLDCHSAAVVTHQAFLHGWPALPGADLPYVTAGLDIRYQRPTPLTEEIRLVGQVLEVSEPEITAAVWIEWDGKRRAEAHAVWKRWRPR